MSKLRILIPIALLLAGCAAEPAKQPERQDEKPAQAEPARAQPAKTETETVPAGPTPSDETVEGPLAPPEEVQPENGFRWKKRRSEHGVPCLDDAAPCSHFVAEYPEFEEGPKAAMVKRLNDAVRELVTTPSFDERRAGSVDGTGRRFLQQYEGEKSQLDGHELHWYDYRTVKVLYQDERVLSLQLDEDLYTGGNHPLPTTLLVTLSLEQGERLSMADLFREEAAEQLNALGERKLRELWQIPAGKSLAEARFDFRGGRFRLNSNFAVNAEGVLFFYNVYEIAPFIQGPSEIQLGRAEIADLVRPEGPLGSNP